MNQLLEFKFKAERTYVHGSDIYNQISSIINDDEYIVDISFRSFSKNNCILKSAPDKSDKIICIAKTNRMKYSLVESVEGVTDNYIFDEDALVANAKVESNSISMNYFKQYTLIENVIALTKKLNYQLEPNVVGKWVFGQLKLLEDFPSEPKLIQINSARRITNRFSENEIIIDNKDYGKIIFIVGNP